MTISTSNRRAGPYLGDGNQREFPFTFRVFKAEDVRAYVADTQSKERALTYGADYRVALHPDQEARPGGALAAEGQDNSVTNRNIMDKVDGISFNGATFKNSDTYNFCYAELWAPA